jgi:DNA topoisomerase-1
MISTSLFIRPLRRQQRNLEAAGERLLGEDPATGKPVLAEDGPLWRYDTDRATESEDKPKFAKLRANQSIDTVTFEEAMELFKLPRVVGEFEGKEIRIKVSIGRFGPYVQHDGKFVSLRKEQRPIYYQSGRYYRADQGKTRG